jgi:hypothetical protein
MRLVSPVLPTCQKGCPAGRRPAGHPETPCPAAVITAAGKGFSGRGAKPRALFKEGVLRLCDFLHNPTIHYKMPPPKVFRDSPPVLMKTF